MAKRGRTATVRELEQVAAHEAAGLPMTPYHLRRKWLLMRRREVERRQGDAPEWEERDVVPVWGNGGCDGC